MLDLDGTLLDIAPTPDAVVVAPGLMVTLVALRDALGGALAVVSGRTVAEVDALLPGVAQAVAGEHGGAMRPAPGAALERLDLPTAPEAWAEAAARHVACHPGALLERKRRGFVVHYRGAPEAGPALHEAVRALVDARFEVMPASMAWEVRPLGADKGSAVRALAAMAPFAGRRPIFIGDDLTDEDGIVAARALGGAGLRVDAAFGTAGDVRAWLAASAARLQAGEGWAALPGEVSQ